MIDLNLTLSQVTFTSELKKEVVKANARLHAKTGAGNDFLGWLNFPLEFDIAEFKRVQKVAAALREKIDVLVVCGIGGSYLGARAVIEALQGLYAHRKVEIIYLGNTFSAPATAQLMAYLEGKRFAVNVISKSGTTTETAIAFRLLRQRLEAVHGDKAHEYIFATTDPKKGLLRQLALEQHYEIFTIPSDIGGRYSVLTSVGMLPLAVAGINVESMIDGAVDACRALNTKKFENNPCYQYAAARYLLSQKKAVEVLVTYEMHLAMFAEWWKQLFGESEGKEGKGLFPASMVFSTDLHSLGQFVQDGNKILFETIINIKKPLCDITIPADPRNDDELNYLAGRSLHEVNQKAMEGTLSAHANTGNVPAIIINLDQLDPYTMGYLIYFMEKACAISAYLLDVNPFNQEGVEVYKRNMFALLGKK